MFQKGCECRFHLPKCHEIKAYIYVDKENSVQWYFIDGSSITVSRYQYMAQRNTGDQFMNMNNDIASMVLGCNTNVGTADRSGFFYVTMYASKQNQTEEKIAFLTCCEALSRRIKRQEQELLNNNQSDDIPTVQEDFSEGFRRVLSAMYAHTSNDVLVATMAHLLLYQNQRFTFSHGFIVIPLPHLLEWYDNGKKNLHFRLRQWCNGNNSGDTQRIADYFIDYQLFKPRELEEYGVYELMMNFEIKKITPAQKEQCENSDKNTSVFRFCEEHPSYKYILLQRRKTIAVPQITSSKLLPNIKDLKIGKNDVSNETTLYREQYAKIALLLFHPFRVKEDLIINGSFWAKYMNLMKNNKLTPTTIKVLQNIQDVNYNCVIGKTTILDPILKSTSYKKCDEDKKFNKQKKDSDDENYASIEELQKAFESIDPDTGYEPDNEKRSMSHLIERHVINEKKIDTKFDEVISNLKDIVNPPESILNTLDGINNNVSSSAWNHDDHFQHDHLIIEYIAYGVFLENWYDIDNQHLTENHSYTPNADVHMTCFANKQGLDFKQTAAFEVIASSYILQCLDSHGINHERIQHIFGVNSIEGTSKLQKLNNLKALLLKKGGITNLFMFLSGMGGSGKSRVINAFKKYTQNISSYFNWHYDFHTVKITAMTGSAAALLPEGRTLHSAACLNKDAMNIQDVDRNEWKHTVVLIIDEISFMDGPDLDNLNRKLKLLRQSDRLFGDVQVIIVGDFHQLNPVGCICPLYKGGNVIMQALNRAIFLNKSHRFKEDEQFGKVLRRLRHGNITIDDIKWINERFVENNNVSLPSADKIRYACNTNEHRNAVSNALFKKHLEATHIRSSNSDTDCPSHTCIIKASLKTRKNANQMLASSFCNLIYDTVGDADMKNGKSKKVDPSLKFYHNKSFMINSNDRITDNLANGTPCRGLYLMLKDSVQFKKECWDGYMVNTVYAHEVDYMICVHEGKKDNDPGKYFKVFPETVSVKIKMQTLLNFKLKGIYATQLGLNDNIATTCHKLQGVSLDSLVVDSFNYGLKNWVYVVLSRVTTRNGLVLCKELDSKQDFDVCENLQRWEEKVQADLEVKLFQTRGEFDEYVNEERNLDGFES